jgi:hypothetical protein
MFPKKNPYVPLTCDDTRHSTTYYIGKLRVPDIGGGDSDFKPYPCANATHENAKRVTG